jgi:hypothetical protein
MLFYCKDVANLNREFLFCLYKKNVVTCVQYLCSIWKLVYILSRLTIVYSNDWIMNKIGLFESGL